MGLKIFPKFSGIVNGIEDLIAEITKDPMILFVFFHLATQKPLKTIIPINQKTIHTFESIG